MDAPSKITVLIDGKDSTESAKLIKYDPMYYAAEYEASDGSRFYIDMGYLAELGGKPARIPIEVITQLEDMRKKLEDAQRFLDRQGKKDSSGLILPPGYDRLK